MPRLRFSYEEARTRAEELARVFVASQSWGDTGRCKGAMPLGLTLQGSSSKHPTVWSVCFVFHPPSVVMDGGELFVTVDLETEEVKVADL